MSNFLKLAVVMFFAFCLPASAQEEEKKDKPIFPIPKGDPFIVGLIKEQPSPAVLIEFHTKRYGMDKLASVANLSTTIHRGGTQVCFLKLAGQYAFDFTLAATPDGRIGLGIEGKKEKCEVFFLEFKDGKWGEKPQRLKGLRNKNGYTYAGVPGVPGVYFVQPAKELREDR